MAYLTTYTDDQARKLVCPLSSREGGLGMCLGTLCMGWVVMHTPEADSVVCHDAIDAEEEPPRPRTIPSSWEFVPASDDDEGKARWYEAYDSVLTRCRGRCGMVHHG